MAIARGAILLAILLFITPIALAEEWVISFDYSGTAKNIFGNDEEIQVNMHDGKGTLALNITDTYASIFGDPTYTYYAYGAGTITFRYDAKRVDGHPADPFFTDCTKTTEFTFPIIAFGAYNFKDQTINVTIRDITTAMNRGQLFTDADPRPKAICKDKYGGNLKFFVDPLPLAPYEVSFAIKAAANEKANVNYVSPYEYGPRLTLPLTITHVGS